MTIEVGGETYHLTEDMSYQELLDIRKKMYQEKDKLDDFQKRYLNNGT